MFSRLEFGETVDPLGDVLMLLLPEGFNVLVAPDWALPAVLVPLIPVVALPPPADPLADPAPAAPAPAAPPAPPPPPPAWAKANVLDSANAVAKMVVLIFMHFLRSRMTEDKKRCGATFQTNFSKEAVSSKVLREARLRVPGSSNGPCCCYELATMSFAYNVIAGPNDE